MSAITAIARPAVSRVLVIANEAARSYELEQAIRSRVGAIRDPQVLVVAPALNRRVRHWVSDEDDARRAAGDRLLRCLQQLERIGIDANGMVGDADPLQAIADALHVFRADEIVIATHPEERAHWLARRLVERARRRFDVPIVHVVVDTSRAAGASIRPQAVASMRPRPPR
jgi:GABA permease